MEQRFCLMQDNDGHWYIVEINDKDRFTELADKSEDDITDEEMSEFEDKFRPVNGNPSRVTFTNPAF